MKKYNSDELNSPMMIFEFMHRTMVHHAMWYAEVRDRLGADRAGELLDTAWKSILSIQIKRLSKVIEIELEDGLPTAIGNLPPDKLEALQEATALNWLATDGVWFQAVESVENMSLAKECNDAAWSQFSPFEALRIKRILKLDEFPGIEGLKRAMEYRLYGTINKQSFANETENSIDFFMNECRVQLARKTKGMADYPCKSAGIIEYSSFAQTIDARIRTRVIHCPPDDHPNNYYCGWHFFIPF